MDTSVLFSGHPIVRGGLSNEEELARLCPSEFLDTHDPWHNCIAEGEFWGRNEQAWKWKNPNPDVQAQQKKCLDNLLDGSRQVLPITTRHAIAAWMLSEMLEEVPPPKRPQG
jgi:hypothetical protein